MPIASCLLPIIKHKKMKFRTEVFISEQSVKIQPNSAILSMGSCFADELAYVFKKSQFQILSNPYGTMFNPFSIAESIERMEKNQSYSESDLLEYKGKIISLDHHTEFDGIFVEDVLKRINESLKAAHFFLQKTQFVFITLGTSFVHRFLPKDKWVANCHKIPNKFFEKQLLTEQQIRESIERIITSIKNICTDEVAVYFTVSPVRHTREGMVENQRSKSRLISALHDVVEQYDTVHYLPIYELMMDDLRDYRFYKEDMIHPSEQAFQYIFEKFSQAFFSPSALDFMDENMKIQQGLAHQPLDEKSIDYINFQRKLKERIKAQQAKVQHTIFSEELQKLPYLL